MAKRYEAIVTVRIGSFKTEKEAIDAILEWEDDILVTDVHGGSVNNVDLERVQAYDNETGMDIDE